MNRWLGCIVVCAASGLLHAAEPGPTQGRVLWLDASDGTTLTREEGAIAEWHDKAGGKSNPAQTDAAKRPVTGDEKLNGHEVIRFGGHQFLSGPAVLPEGSNQYTIIALWRPATNEASQSIVEQAGAAVTSNQRAALLAVPGAYGFNGQDNDKHDLVPYEPEEWRLTCMSIDNSKSKNVRIEDNGKVYEAGSGNPGALHVAAGELTIGRKAARDDEYFQGEVAEIMIYDRLLGAEEQGKVLGDLREKWDLKKEADAARQAISNDVLYDETYRPQFHFSAKKNWLNDPNGLVYYAGEYHLFFQANPEGMTSNGIMSWGHAIGTDLLHWKEVDIAIAPDKLGSIWSGSAVVDWNNTSGFATGPEKTIVCIYCCAGGVNPESKGQPFTQCLSYSNDRGRTWTKYEKNPVVRHIAGGNRDPKVVWHEGSKQWIMALYLQNQQYVLLGSPDLKNWKMLDQLPKFGCDECPDFYSIAVEGDSSKVKWVFAGANGNYLVGDFDGNHFAADSPEAQRIEWGRNCYADQTFSDIPKSDGRRILIGWMAGGNYPSMPFNQQMSFPTALKLRQTEHGLRLFRTPIGEISQLRVKSQEVHDVETKDGENALAWVQSDLVEIEATIDPEKAEGFEIGIRGRKVTYRTADHRISCLGASADLPEIDGKVELHILVDRSSIELFGNEGWIAMSSCFTPKPSNRNYSLAGIGGPVKIVSLKAHELKSIWR